jgi:O-antigen ligase
MAIALPLTLGAVWVAQLRWAQASCVAYSGYLLKLLYDTHNRAAGVGLIGALLVMWIGAKYKVRVLILVAPIGLAAVVAFYETPYWDRFANQIFRDGQFVGSALSRIEIWKASTAVVRSHPIVGVGPGAFAHNLKSDREDVRGYLAHNSLIELLCETGVPGVSLFVAFFFYLLVHLYRIKGHAAAWKAATATSLQAALVAYLLCGLFVSRQDLALAYIVAGCGVSLGPSPPCDNRTTAD